MQRRAKRALYLAGAALAVALFFAFGLPAILKAVLVSQLSKNLHRPATVEAVRFNPFTLSLTVEGLSVREPDDRLVFFSFDRLVVNAEIASVFEGGIDLYEVRLEKPYVRVLRAVDNRYNFSDLLAGEEKKSDAEPSGPVRFSVANIRITGGTVDFDDRPKKARHRVSGIELGLPLISNFKHHVDSFVQPSFSATVNGRPFRLSGRTKPFADSLETTLDINIADLNLPKFLAYAPARLHFNMPAGRLSTRLKLHYVQNAGKAAQIRVSGTVKLAGLAIVGLDGAPVLSLPSLAVSGIACAVNSRELTVDDIALQGLTVALAREKDGSLSLQHLLAAEAGADNDTSPAPEATEGPSWSVLVKKFTCTGGAVTFDDLLPPRPARVGIDQVDIALSNVATARDARAGIGLSCRINTETRLGMTGSFSLAPPAANLNVDLANLDLRLAQSYLPDTLLLDITGGTLGLKGSVAFAQTENTVPAVSWQGDVRLVQCAVKRKGDKNDLLKFSTLDLQAMRAGTSPPALDIQTIRLSGFFLRPVVSPDGTVNIASLSAEPAGRAPQPAPSPAASEPLPDIHIGSIVLENGRVQFTDTSIHPRYATELAGIKGRMTDISTKPEAQAAVNLSAKLNRYAPLSITGTMRPLQDKLDADITIALSNIDMHAFSPYAGKYIGRLIEKGRLSLDLACTVKDNRLSSRNKALLDQFTLGKSVASPDATSLPVGLAVSLLKDRKGEIHLDLPVSGSLDDPSFKIGKVVLQVLKNLLEKAATSPFALVGALIPAGMDVSTIAFPCGTAELSDEAVTKLDALAGLLADKPGLRLEIQAVADDAADREGLRREMVMRKLRRLKFDDMSDRERKGLTPGQVVITANEYEDYLWQAYKAEPFEKQTGFLGLTKRLPADEMKKLMADHVTVDDDDLKELVQRRSLAAKQYLTGTANVPAERIFIVDARIDSGRGEAGCAVEFMLK